MEERSEGLWEKSPRIQTSSPRPEVRKTERFAHASRDAKFHAGSLFHVGNAVAAIVISKSVIEGSTTAFLEKIATLQHLHKNNKPGSK